MRIDAIGLFAKSMEISATSFRDAAGMKTDWNGGAYAEFQMGDGSRFIMYGRDDFEGMLSKTLDCPKKNQRYNGSRTGLSCSFRC